MFRQTDSSLMVAPKAEPQDNNNPNWKKPVALGVGATVLLVGGLCTELQKIGDGDYDSWEVAVKALGTALILASGILVNKVYNTDYVQNAVGKIGLFSRSNVALTSLQQHESAETSQNRLSQV